MSPGSQVHTIAVATELTVLPKGLLTTLLQQANANFLFHTKVLSFIQINSNLTSRNMPEETENKTFPTNKKKVIFIERVPKKKEEENI